MHPDAPRAAATHDPFAAELRRFGAIGIGAVLVVLAGNALFIPGSGLLALAWRWRSRTPWSELGYARSQHPLAEIGAGAAMGSALCFLLRWVVLPGLGIAPRAHPELAHNPAAVPAMLYLIFAGSGFGEETTFRGFLFERLGCLLGRRGLARAATLVTASLLFGAAHYLEQGWGGVTQSTLSGLVFGLLYLATGRLWMPMAAHIAFNLTAYALIYWSPGS
jgi:membrane protease YdiL (CAAX protease family)